MSNIKLKGDLRSHGQYTGEDFKDLELAGNSIWVTSDGAQDFFMALSAYSKLLGYTDSIPAIEREMVRFLETRAVLDLFTRSARNEIKAFPSASADLMALMRGVYNSAVKWARNMDPIEPAVTVAAHNQGPSFATTIQKIKAEPLRDYLLSIDKPIRAFYSTAVTSTTASNNERYANDQVDLRSILAGLSAEVEGVKTENADLRQQNEKLFSRVMELEKTAEEAKAMKEKNWEARIMAHEEVMVKARQSVKDLETKAQRAIDGVCIDYQPLPKHDIAGESASHLQSEIDSLKSTVDTWKSAVTALQSMAPSEQAMRDIEYDLMRANTRIAVNNKDTKKNAEFACQTMGRLVDMIGDIFSMTPLPADYNSLKDEVRTHSDDLDDLRTMLLSLFEQLAKRDTQLNKHDSKLAKQPVFSDGSADEEQEDGLEELLGLKGLTGQKRKAQHSEVEGEAGPSNKKPPQ